MSHIQVLKQAWRLLWRNRALWVFGIILALTTFSWETAAWRGGGNSRSGSGQGPAYNFRLPPEFPSFETPRWEDGLPPQARDTLIAAAVGLACLIVVLIVAFAVGHYVSETALIRMVNQHEETGEQLGVRQGFRLGWSRTAWRLFLMDLLIDVPAGLVALLLLLLALAPLLLWATGSETLGVIGTVAAIGMVFLVLFLVIIAAVGLTLIKVLGRRVCALEGRGVTASIRQGYAIVRRNLKDVGQMWLIMAGVSIGWPIAMAPVAILLIGVGVLLGGGSALVARGLSGLLLSGTAAWIVAGVVGGLLFILVLAVPLTFLGGLRETFQSSTWTLTFRELRALQELKPGSQPAGLEAQAAV